MPSGKKRKGHKMATHKRKKRLKFRLCISQAGPPRLRRLTAMEQTFMWPISAGSADRIKVCFVINSAFDNAHIHPI